MIKVARKKKMFVVQAKSGKFLISARNKDEAFIKFFEMLYNGKVGLEEIGQVIILYDGKKKYALRTVPTLWLLGLLDTESAIESLKRIIKNESEGKLFDLLLETAKQDAWVAKGVWKIE